LVLIWSELFILANTYLSLNYALVGVAPRAKMNQQRQRRYRSAETLVEAQKESGTKAPFDSNCITPGTPFMGRLSEVIKFYIQKKIKEDQSWRDVEIIFSGHEVPGEGEHKILEYIRHQKSTSNYHPNLSHCMYGLDADLIMLSLVSHEPHFSLIREDDVLKNNRTKSPIASFHFLHISLLREYLSLDFGVLKKTLPTSMAWDLERIIDDFILLCFLVGNDFLPTLPLLNIAEGSLNRILDTYKKVLPSIGGYLTEKGQIKLDHLEQFFRAFCLGEENNFDIIPHGHEKLDRPRHVHKPNRRGRGAHGGGVARNAYGALESSGDSPAPSADLAAILYAQRQADSDSDDSEIEDEDTLQPVNRHLQVVADRHAATASPASVGSSVSQATSVSTSSEEGEYNPLDHPSKLAVQLSELKMSDGGDGLGIGLFGAEGEGEPFDAELWKLTYYREKLGMDLTDTQAHEKLRTCYLEGLIWVYHYYFHGCISWSWFFPYHYAPLISDLVEISKYAPNIKFERSKPFKPYQQLLGVLPPKSAALLPPAYQHLLLSETSPLHPYCPATLEIDREGTKNEWEGVVLLPFMDESVIVHASESVPLEKLTQAEIKANMVGNAYTYKYDPTISDTVHSPQKDLFDDLIVCGSEALVYHHPDPSDPAMLVPVLAGQPPLLNSFRLLPGTHLGLDKPPTLPTLFSIKLMSSLQKNRTRVLQRPAQQDSLVLRLLGFVDDEEAAAAEGKAIKYVRRDKRADTISLDIEFLACEYQENSCYVWPYNREAKVVAIMDEEGYYDTHGNPITGMEGEVKEWRHKVKTLDDFSEEQQATDINDIRCIFEVRYLNGVSRALDGSLKKEWAEKTTLVPFQCILEKVPFGPDPRFLERAAPPLSVQYPMHSSVVYIPTTPGPLYGVTADVMAHNEETNQVTVSIDQIERINPLTGTNLVASEAERWYSARDVAKHAGLSPQFLGRIASCILLDDRTDLGLNLRFQGRSQQTLSYTRRIETVDRATGEMRSWWEYSQKALNLILDYVSAFPDIMDLLSKNNADSISAHEIFKHSEAKELEAQRAAAADSAEPSGDSPSPDHFEVASAGSGGDNASDDGGDKPKVKKPRKGAIGPNFVRQKQMLEWLSHHRPSKSLRVACGTVGLDRESIAKMEQELNAWEKSHPAASNPKSRTFTVPRTQVFSPLPPLEVLHKNNVDAAGKGDFKLGERAVYILNSGAVPFGTTGTIVTVSKTHVELLLDTALVGGTDLSGRCSHRRGISVQHGAVINATAPFRKAEISLRGSGSSGVPAWTHNSSDRIRSSQDGGRRGGGGGGNGNHGGYNNRHGGNHDQQQQQQQSGQHGGNRYQGGNGDHQQGGHRGGRSGTRGGHQAGHASSSPQDSQGQGHQASRGQQMRQSQEAQPQQRHHKEKPAKATSSAAPAPSKGTNVPAGAPKKITTRTENAKAAGQAKPHKEKHQKKDSKPDASSAAPSGKQVDVGALFAPAGGAQGSAAPPADALKSIPGLSLDAQQLSFFNSLSAGFGHAYAQQNMPAVQAPAYSHPSMMMQPPMSAPMHMPPYAGQQAQGRPSVALDSIFQASASSNATSSAQSSAPSGTAVPIDALLPAKTNPSDTQKQ
jgi:5'-3' exoribonuclease 1